MREKMPKALNSVARGGRTRSAAGALIIKTLEHFLRTTDREVSLNHVPSWCDGGLARSTADAVSDLWEAIRDPNGTAPVSHDCYLKLFFLGDHQVADADRTLLLDEAQDADPVILGLVRVIRVRACWSATAISSSINGVGRSTRWSTRISKLR